ncbi:putative phosphonate metabolism protein [Stella humosa]|uniref:Putative phosphonate metabolism protein n=1 Tax=Stella humosa TaxID=94 RepID=A0A3N1MF96_9PROT|nr:DUF1045 domain-containing protein [Stella humosa]ROQ01387.1 putative phosphonate metabolism protein [Stella humosa]BBK31762.1 hypothetical protein STHU_23960 [Stella humosa]
MTDRRFAVYFAPPAESPLARFAAGWLGHCPEGYPAAAGPPVPGISDARMGELVADAARYGFHGTLKPPFRLAEGRTEQDLSAAMTVLARRFEPFTLPPLRLVAIGGFLALVPAHPCARLEAVASACVTELDRFRRPPDEAELARRRRARLSERQEQMLARWGYPYVLDEFQFHLTLTARLDPAEAALIRPVLDRLTAPLIGQPLPFADLALFIQPAAGAPFTIERRFPLAPTAGPTAS